MKQTWLIMGMPINVIIEDGAAGEDDFKAVRDYFIEVDEKYSPYKQSSEVSRINDGLPKAEWSREMKDILRLCEQTKRQTKGYFDVWHEGRLDPSGLVKGWAVDRASRMLAKRGLRNFYVEAGGDVQVSGHNAEGKAWTVGIRNPFNRDEIVKVLGLATEGIATSGTYIRGRHIYDPHDNKASLDDVASLTVIGPNIYDADRFATAAFAMGRPGISFIEKLDGHEAYMITSDRRAIYTSGFERYVEQAA